MSRAFPSCFSPDSYPEPLAFYHGPKAKAKTPPPPSLPIPSILCMVSRVWPLSLSAITMGPAGVPQTTHKQMGLTLSHPVSSSPPLSPSPRQRDSPRMPMWDCLPLQGLLWPPWWNPACFSTIISQHTPCVQTQQETKSRNLGVVNAFARSDR